MNDKDMQSRIEVATNLNRKVKLSFYLPDVPCSEDLHNKNGNKKLDKFITNNMHLQIRNTTCWKLIMQLNNNNMTGLKYINNSKSKSSKV